jgi:hypothetical protein
MDMGPQCFLKKDSNPPLCGVHNLPVTRESIPIDPDVPDLGRITCFVCPVSRKVLSDNATQE